MANNDRPQGNNNSFLKLLTTNPIVSLLFFVGSIILLVMAVIYNGDGEHLLLAFIAAGNCIFGFMVLREAFSRKSLEEFKANASSNPKTLSRNTIKILLAAAACLAVFVLISTVNSIVAKSVPHYERHETAFKTTQGERVSKEVIAVSDGIILPIAEKHGIDDLKLEKMFADLGIICYYKSDKFADLSDEDKFNFILDINKVLKTTEYPFKDANLTSTYEQAKLQHEDNITECRIITGDEDTYGVSTDSLHGNYRLLKNQSEMIYESHVYNEEFKPYTRKTCTYCNGTGSAKYNYGDSDLQALLEGEDPYTMGDCPYCNGTGYED